MTGSLQASRSKRSVGSWLAGTLRRAARAGAVWLWAIAFVLAGLKLGLVKGRPLTAIGGAGHDDELFLTLANHLLETGWLGPYSVMTLVKGPFYPMFIAANYKTGLPLLWTEHVFYVFAALVALWAIGRALDGRRGLQLMAFVLVLFGPATYSFEASRAIRSSIYPALTLLVVAAAVGLYLAILRDASSRYLWATALGLAMGAFWLTREEGVWLVPSIAVLLLAGVARLGGRTNPDIDEGWRWWSRATAAIALPLVIWAAVVMAVAAQNYRSYGVFVVNELKDGSFEDGFGALKRVRQSPWRPYVGVPRATRDAIYRVSPSFRELEPHLEQPGFWDVGCSTGLYPESCGDIASGWFMWALRDATARAGHHTSGVSAADFYDRLDHEIDAACERRVLDCHPDRDSLAPRLRGEQVRRLPRVFGTALVAFLRLGYKGDLLRMQWSIGVEPHPSTGVDSQLEFARRLTRNDLADGSTGSASDLALKHDVLGSMAKGYELAVPVLSVLALVSYLGGVLLIGRRGVSALLVVNTALLGGVLALLLVLSLVEVSSFPAIHTMYLSPAYPLLFLFIVLAPTDLLSGSGRGPVLRGSVEPDRR